MRQHVDANQRQHDALQLGADGRLASTAPANGGATYTLTPHWDGDDLLYTTSPYGGLQLYIYIEKLGVMYCSSASNCAVEEVYDRDWSGTAVNTHDETGYPALILDTLHSQYCNFQPKSGSCMTTAAPAKNGGASDPSYSAIITPPLDAIRTDGYSDGTNVFQGVRAYDPNMNQWTTPDAYAGDVHDPMSQKPYMWNGNNPVQYSDPSGYEIVLPLPAVGGSVASAAAAVGSAAFLFFVAISTGRTANDHTTHSFDRAPGMGGPGDGTIRRGNTINYYDVHGNRTKRVDLTGKGHNGVDTPHTHEYGPPNRDPDGNLHPGNETGVRPSTPEEVQDAESRPQGASDANGKPTGNPT